MFFGSHSYENDTIWHKIWYVTCCSSPSAWIISKNLLTIIPWYLEYQFSSHFVLVFNTSKFSLDSTVEFNGQFTLESNLRIRSSAQETRTIGCTWNRSNKELIAFSPSFREHIWELEILDLLYFDWLLMYFILMDDFSDWIRAMFMIRY